MSRRVLVLGAGGQVGRALLRATWPGGWDVQALSRAQADITNETAIEDVLVRLSPSLLINCAAYTAVDKAESDVGAAFRANAEAAESLAKLTAAREIPLLHFSTDYVFDGIIDRPYREDDPVHPLNVYGASKAAGEEAVRAANSRHLILRTSWVYAPWGHNFLQTMLRLAPRRDEVRVVDDQTGAPTSALFVAKAVLSIAEQLRDRPDPPWGTYHLSAAGRTSWLGFAAEIFRRLEKAPRLRPIASADYAAPARRPPCSLLDNDKINRAFGIEQSLWLEQLDDAWRLLPR